MGRTAARWWIAGSSGDRSSPSTPAVTPCAGLSRPARRSQPLLDHDDPSHAMSPAPKRGIFIIAPIDGPVGDRILEIQGAHDPRLLELCKPHVTIPGSSRMVPIYPSTPGAT